jgi:hypothetical protein
VSAALILSLKLRGVALKLSIAVSFDEEEIKEKAAEDGESESAQKVGGLYEVVAVFFRVFSVRGLQDQQYCQHLILSTRIISRKFARII